MSEHDKCSPEPLGQDRSLLRPFDEAAAKAGEPICWSHILDEMLYVAGPDSSGRVCTESGGSLCLHSPSGLRMRPLTWVEGRPVYKGNTLYGKAWGEYKPFVVASHEDGKLLTSGVYYYEIGNCSWKPPTVTHEVWVNLHRPAPGQGYMYVGLYKTQAEAESAGTHSATFVLQTIHLTWEEPQ